MISTTAEINSLRATLRAQDTKISRFSRDLACVREHRNRVIRDNEFLRGRLKKFRRMMEEAIDPFDTGNPW